MRGLKVRTWVARKSPQGRPYIPFGREPNYIYAHTTKSCIYKVKNILEKSVYIVREHTVSIPVLSIPVYTFFCTYHTFPVSVLRCRCALRCSRTTYPIVKGCSYFRCIGDQLLFGCVSSFQRNPLHLFVFGATAPQWAMASSFTRFLDHTRLRSTVGRTPLDEWSALRRDLCLTTHNIQNRPTFMPPQWDSNPRS